MPPTDWQRDYPENRANPGRRQSRLDDARIFIVQSLQIVKLEPALVLLLGQTIQKSAVTNLSQLDRVGRIENQLHS